MNYKELVGAEIRKWFQPIPGEPPQELAQCLLNTLDRVTAEQVPADGDGMTLMAEREPRLFFRPITIEGRKFVWLTLSVPVEELPVDARIMVKKFLGAIPDDEFIKNSDQEPLSACFLIVLEDGGPGNATCFSPYFVVTATCGNMFAYYPYVLAWQYESLEDRTKLVSAGGDINRLTEVRPLCEMHFLYTINPNITAESE